MVMMRKSRLSQSKQARLQEHFVAGTTARCAASLVGVNFKTSAYYYRRLRELIAFELELETLKFLAVRLKLMKVILVVRFTQRLFQMLLQKHYTPQ
jgi:transposase-like protein